MTGQDLALVIAAVFSGLGGLTSVVMARRVVDVNDLRAAVKDLEARLTERDAQAEKQFQIISDLRDEVDQYRIGLGLLISQLVAAGLVPVWTPKNREPHE